MSNKAFDFIRAVESETFTEEDGQVFAQLLEEESDKDARRIALEYFLAINAVVTSHIEVLSTTNVVASSLDLQLVVKRFIANAEYRKSEADEKNESFWAKLLQLLFGGI